MGGLPRLTPGVAGGLVAALSITVQATAVATGAIPAWLGASDAAIQATLVLIGVYAWRRRPDSRTGLLLLLTAVGLAPVNLVFSDLDGLRTLGMLAIATWGAPLSWLLLGFPSGALHGRDLWVGRALVAHVTVQWWAFLLLYPQDNVLAVTSGRGVFDVLVVAHIALNVAFALYVLVVLVRRHRALTPAAARAFAPILGTGAWAALITVVTSPAAYDMLDDGPPTPLVQVAWAVGFTAVPLGILVGLLRTRASRAHLGLLVERLGATPKPDGLRDALAAALGDPTVQLGFWVREVGGYRDVDGRTLVLPDAGQGRAVTPLGDPARPPAVLVHDPALAEDEGLLEAVGAAAAVAVENARLQAEARAQLAEADAARGRLVDAADAARRRIERELREGPQASLDALSTALHDLDASLTEERRATIGSLVGAASGLVVHAQGELADLARGVYPVELVEQGLGAALRGLADRSPLPVDVIVDPALAGQGRPPAGIEAAVFFACREALTNAVKHAHAAHATVRVQRRRGRVLATVNDDGRGGADPSGGTGLSGLVDRVAAHGGRVTVVSPLGAGTIVSMALPLRSGGQRPQSDEVQPGHDVPLRALTRGEDR